MRISVFLKAMDYFLVCSMIYVCSIFHNLNRIIFLAEAVLRILTIGSCIFSIILSFFWFVHVFLAILKKRIYLIIPYVLDCDNPDLSIRFSLNQGRLLL